MHLASLKLEQVIKVTMIEKRGPRSRPFFLHLHSATGPLLTLIAALQEGNRSQSSLSTQLIRCRASRCKRVPVPTSARKASAVFAPSPGLTCGGKIASGMNMGSRWRFVVLLLAVWMLFFGPQMQAATGVTFQVVTSFDYPGALDTSPSGINESGTVVGSFVNGFNQVQSFVRYPDGTFSQPIVYPNAQSTYLSGLNNTGTMCGTYLLGGFYHGFFLSGSIFTNFDLNTPNTLLKGVNDAGNFCGTTIDQGFVSIDGTVTRFDIPQQAIVDAYGINNLNRVVGGAVANHGYEIEYSFLRRPDGKLRWPIYSPDFRNTGMFGVDDKGRMVGFVTDLDAPTEAVFLRGTDQFTYFVYPGAIFTEFTDINNRGLLCGQYDSPDGKQHGFIARVRDEE